MYIEIAWKHHSALKWKKQNEEHLLTMLRLLKKHHVTWLWLTISKKKPKFKKISWKKLRNIAKETSEWKKFSNLICRQAEEENYWEEEKKKKKKWIRDNMNMCQCTGPASQITILEKKKKNLHKRFHTVTKLSWPFTMMLRTVTLISRH